MRHVVIPKLGAAKAWRDAARDCLGAGLAPDQVLWGDSSGTADLFAGDAPQPMSRNVTVPRSFISLADTVVWHNDPQRFARLYGFVWRLRATPALMSDRGDADLARLRGMEKNVRRCQHKMKAFVRFREIGSPGDARRSFAAWFEPTHHTVEPTAQFFANRFGDMDWRIITPDVSAVFENGALRFDNGQPRPDLPTDASEGLWITYFRNIFNPARLKVKAMQSEMPKKYWKNMPETAVIPDLIREAPARACAMAAAAPTMPPARMGRVQAQLDGYHSAWGGYSDALPAAISACTRCPLHRTATRAVPGAGPKDARVMIVGGQPGDHEDLSGRLFVGPAGQFFDKVARDARLDRSRVYMTNAVKHFKFTPRGRQRIEQRPDRSEIAQCRWWLNAEISRIKPRLIVAMGTIAAQALTGTGTRILARRGQIEQTPSGPVLITSDPSDIMPTSDVATSPRAVDLFQNDLAHAASWLT